MNRGEGEGEMTNKAFFPVLSFSPSLSLALSFSLSLYLPYCLSRYLPLSPSLTSLSLSLSLSSAQVTTTPKIA